ncbi:MAG: SGNH/GDSL hydrolase family protein [Actinomycetota bacterium]
MQKRLAAAIAVAVLGTLLGADGGRPAIGLGTGTQVVPGPSTTYVALGDSYTAGPLIPMQKGSPEGCLRSDHDYPALAAASLGVGVFRDVSCSGASTRHMYEPHGVTWGTNPPQLDAVTPNTAIVSVGIGGNDIGFGEIVERCVNVVPPPIGTPCRAYYTAGGADLLSQRITETAPKIDALLDEIRIRAPDALVFVVGYPVILPHKGKGCWPAVPILPQDVPYLRAKHQELNQMLSAQAAANGVDFVDAYVSSIGHDVCRLPTVRWVEGAVPTLPAAPVHPNALGMEHVASRLVTAILAAEG